MAASLVEQTPAELPTFEVASIHKVAPLPVMGKQPDGSALFMSSRLVMKYVSLKDMIETAYGIKEHQLSGPPWLGEDRFDVEANVSTATTSVQMRLMLQALLADRFKLVVHHDSKEIAVTAVVKGKGKPRLGDPKPEGPVSIGIEGGKLMFNNYSMSKLADYLSARSDGRPIVDETGIEGYYDFGIQLVDSPSGNIGAVKRAMGTVMRDGSLPSMVADQLGLKLENRKRPAEVIVVDRAERVPDEN